MKMMIWFDMDGTIADLYAVEGWLEALRAEQTTPYELAEPMLRMSTLARQLNAVQRHGYGIGIISWCSKVSTEEYDRRTAKRRSLGWQSTCRVFTGTRFTLSPMALRNMRFAALATCSMMKKRTEAHGTNTRAWRSAPNTLPKSSAPLTGAEVLSKGGEKLCLK